MTHPMRIRLVWIDMEMTGLDPKNEGIIEIATIITNEKLKVMEEGPNLVIHQSEKLLNRMDSWNLKQHQKSGLIERVKESKVTVKKAEDVTLDFIKQHCEAKKSYLCGNSVHHDRRFLERYMPRIHEYLHYRHIDVSTIKSLAQFWYPKQHGLYRKSSKHRALEDIRDSIHELGYYRTHYFKRRLTPGGQTLARTP